MLRLKSIAILPVSLESSRGAEHTRSWSMLNSQHKQATSIQIRGDLIEEASLRAKAEGVSVEQYINQLLDMYFRTEDRPVSQS